MTDEPFFTVRGRDDDARLGRLATAHGLVETPAFMTVATLGAVKGVLFDRLRQLGAQIVLMNAFHLAWRPGEEIVAALGGLHRFTGWNGPLLTDSGGFQIFSLPGLRKLTEEGAIFAGPTDGRVRTFSPESVVELQWALGTDILMPLDECPPHQCRREEIERAVERSVRWAERSRRRFEELRSGNGGKYSGEKFPRRLFGIVQGGTDAELRKRSAEATAKLKLDGSAVGGVCVGETAAEARRTVALTAPLLPPEKPRYLMGLGTPEDLLHAVARGMDLFDCTIPTRNGRNGTLYTSAGLLRLKNARHARDERPLDPACDCYTCRNFSRAALRHLFFAKELNAATLLSLHNLAFYLRLMREVRAAIRAGKFSAFKAARETAWQKEEERPK